MAAFSGAVAAQPDSGSFVTVNDSVEVWERSALPLRADTSNAAHTVDLPIVDVNDGQGAVPANREQAAVYDPGTTVTVNLEEPTGADPYGLNNNNSNVQVQVLVARLNESGDADAESLTTDLGELEDMFATDKANNNVTIVANDSYSELANPFSYDFTPQQSGHYAVVVTQVENGSGAQVDADGNVTSIDGDLYVLGMESLAVQEAAGSATPQDSTPAPGESVTFDVDSNLNSASQVNHSLVVYKKDTFTSSVWEFTYDGDFTSDTNASDVEVEHSITEVNGVGNISDNTELLGTSVSARETRGMTNVQDIVTFLANESDTASPQLTENGSTVLHGSAVAVQGSQSEQLTVETLGNWSEGQYQYVYIATGADSSQFSTDTGTISVQEPQSISLSLDDTEIEDGDTTSATVTATLSDGSTQDVTNQATITSSNTNVATVSGSTITGESSGTTTIQATYQSESDSVQLTVTSGGGGGGGGGGDDDDDGGVTSPPPTTQPPERTIEAIPNEGNTSTAVERIENNTRVNIVPPETDEDRASAIRFDRISATTTRTVDFELTTTRSRTAPDPDTPAPPSNRGGLSYLHLEYPDHVPDSVTDVEFRFRVSKDRLEQLDEQPEDVELYRLEDDEWQDLDAEQTDETDTHYVYRADSPGLSLFAVSTQDPDIRVTSASLSATEVTVGESITVTAELENQGGTGEETIELASAGDTLASQTVQLASGETTTIEFDVSLDADGEYELTVQDVVAGTLTVSQAGEPTEGPGEGPTEGPAEPGGPGNSTALLIAFLIVVLLAGVGAAYYLQQQE